MLNSIWYRALAFTALLFACAPSPPPEPVALFMEEVLTIPSPESMRLALLPAERAEIYVEYGEAREEFTNHTSTLTRDARQLATFELSGLQPGQQYHYRVRIRRPSEVDFGARAVESFRTLYTNPEAILRFAYAADSHITGRFLKMVCSGREEAKERISNFEQTLANIASSDLDFLIAGGDTFMTHAPKLKSCGEWEDLGKGTAQSAQEASRRYELALSARFWGRLTPSLPFLYVLGNHDGEAPFGDPTGMYGHFTNTRALSREARFGHLPDPTQHYAGSNNGDLFFTFTSGPARFIILDVMAGTPAIPHAAGDWTLGATQLAWFEDVLKANESPWILVFIEHVVGGVAGVDGLPLVFKDGPKGDYHYGRAGIRGTSDGTINGDFLGEQAKLQALMSYHGVNLFFHAHDHVAVVGEKRKPDGSGSGVYYAMGGQASGSSDGPGWINTPWFKEAMDYDEDGEADYYSDVNGTRFPGYYEITVRGRDRTDVRFVRSDLGDASTAFSFSLFPDGSSTLPAPPRTPGR